jgi:hypothetical protein
MVMRKIGNFRITISKKTGKRGLSITRSFKADDAMRTNKGPMAHIGWQIHTIPRSKINVLDHLRRIRKNKADRTLDTVKDLLITMAVNRVVIAWTIRPGVRRKSLSRHTAAQLLLLWRNRLLPANHL